MDDVRAEIKWIVIGVLVFVAFVIIPTYVGQERQLNIRKSDIPVIENLLRGDVLKITEFKLDGIRAHLVQVAEDQYLVICDGEGAGTKCAQYKLIRRSVK